MSNVYIIVLVNEQGIDCIESVWSNETQAVLAIQQHVIDEHLILESFKVILRQDILIQLSIIENEINRFKE